MKANTLEGHTCGQCMQGKLKASQDEPAPGVWVQAFRCPHCGETWYDEQTARHVEALWRQDAQERQLLRVGSSLAVTIPAKIVRTLGLKEKGKILLRSWGKAVLIQPAPRQG